MGPFYQDYYKKALETYPSLSALEGQLDWENLISPFIFSLPQKYYQQAQQFIKDFYTYTRSNDYQKSLIKTEQEETILQNKNSSVLMAYDFHLNFATEEMKLIEVNTNASGFLLVDLIYQVHNIKSDSLSLLKGSFEEEISQQDSKKITIIDEDIFNQNMYKEFLMYKDLFESWGYQAQIHNYDDLTYDDKKGLMAQNQECGFIYNRYCDFLLTDSVSKHIWQAYSRGQNTFSPNPKEYLLAADKSRLIEISQGLHSLPTSSMQKALLEAKNINDFESPEDLWKQRKKYFFKPVQSYGSKSTYRGASISKSVFQRMYDDGSMVQEYFPPDKIHFNEQDWKFDLRFYVFKDQIQQVTSRIYQGQVTNFKTANGGFTAVQLVNE